MTRRLVTLVVGSALAALAPLDRAAACSGLECYPDQFVPRAGFVPANLPGVAWWSGQDWRWSDADGGELDSIDTTPADLRFECKAQDGAVRSVSFEAQSVSQGLAHLLPSTALQPGERCTIESTAIDCDLQDADFLLNGPDFNRGYLSGRAEFHVSEPAALPATLGNISVQPALIERLELSEGGACSGLEYVCAVRARLSWSSDAEPWYRALVLSTEVDGKPWTVWRSAIVPLERGASYVGRGHELFFARLPDVPRSTDSASLTRGRHTVVMRATLPGTDIALATEPVEIDLDCGSFAADGGSSTDSGARSDAGMTPDAGDLDAAEPDAAAPSRPGSTRGRRIQERDGNGACAALGPPQRGARPALATIFALVAVWLRRRRLRRAGAARSPGRVAMNSAATAIPRALQARPASQAQPPANGTT